VPRHCVATAALRIMFKRITQQQDACWEQHVRSCSVITITTCVWLTATSLLVTQHSVFVPGVELMWTVPDT
jgi:hypothetical protein